MKFSIIMQSTICVLNYLSHKNKKVYCYPSQEKILKLLKKYYGITIRRRQLNNVLAFLEKSKYIERKRRLKKTKEGKLVFNTTLYWIKKRAYSYLAKIVGTIKRTGFNLKEGIRREFKKEASLNDQQRYLYKEEERQKNKEKLKQLLAEI